MEENKNSTTNDNVDLLHDEMSKQILKIRRQGMLIGAQTSAKAILEKMYVSVNKKSKVSYRDYVRLFDEIENFCVTALSRTLDENGEIIPRDVTQDT